MSMDRKTHLEKTRAGMAAAALEGRVPGRPVTVTDDQVRAVMHLGTTEAAQRLGLGKVQYLKRRRRIDPENADG